MEDRLYSILVVEDEFDIRENLNELLESEGFNVYTAADGVEGFNLAKSNLPDLILSDVRMPKMDGIQLLNELQNDPETSAIPLIFLSAKVEMTDIRQGMLNGADDYITKPFKADEVLMAIDARLKKKQNYLNIIRDLRNSFIKNVPHELRTPLISILGFSELIETDIENLSQEEIIDIVGRINKSGKRLHRRIEKLIRYGYLLSLNEKDFENIYTEIDENLFAAIMNKSAKDAGRKDDIKIKVEEAELCIENDLFFEMISELFENSVKFSEPRTPIVLCGEKKNDNYVISIADKGIGIGIKKIEEIDPFNKLDRKLENKEGLGLGLAIVKRISELFNVKINIESDKDSFTKISLVIKLKQ